MTQASTPKKKVAATKKTAPKKSKQDTLVEQWGELKAQMNPAEIQIVSRVIYKHSFKILFNMILIFAAITIFTIGVSSFKSQPPVNHYFAETPSGQLTELQPLNKPLLTNVAIVNWAGRVVPEIFSFDFQNFDSQINRAGNKYFTQGGFDAFVQAMRPFRAYIRSHQYIVTTSLRNQPIIEKHGQIDESFAWQVSVPVIVKYTGKDVVENKQLITLVITRTPKIKSPDGIQIAKFTLSGGMVK